MEKTPRVQEIRNRQKKVFATFDKAVAVLTICPSFTSPGCHVELEKAHKIVGVFERYGSGTESMPTLAVWFNRQGYRTKGK